MLPVRQYYEQTLGHLIGTTLLTCCKQNGEVIPNPGCPCCAAITVDPRADPLFGKFNVKCISVLRKAPGWFPGCTLQPYTPVNNHFIFNPVKLNAGMLSFSGTRFTGLSLHSPMSTIRVLLLSLIRWMRLQLSWTPALYTAIRRKMSSESDPTWKDWSTLNSNQETDWDHWEMILNCWRSMERLVKRSSHASWLVSDHAAYV